VDKIIFAVVLFVFGFFNGCHKPCNLPNYTFSVNDFFSPEKDSVNIGDTLWIRCIISKTQIDVNTQEQVNFYNAENLGFSLVISDISRFDLKRGAVDSFTYITLHGSIYTDSTSNSTAVKQLSFEENNDSYLLEVGLIAKESGSYILTIPDNPYVYRKGMAKCGTANFLIVNRNTNKHLYLFENRWGKLSAYDSAHSFCFKVY
jgi:hypothetical protein